MGRMNKAKKKKENKLKLSLKSLSLREKILLLISAIIFIFLIGNFVFIRPIILKGVDVQNEIVALNLEKTQGITSNETNNRLINEYSLDEEKYNSLMKEFENNINQEELVKELIQLGKDNGIQIKDITFEKGQEEATVKKIINNSGTINIQGEYSNILNFIKGVQNSSNEVLINGVNIAQKNNDINQINTSKEYTATININYFNIVKGSSGNE
ncbi:type 4a pilus biogenesis protein PilO [uncultured Clostridium sp.]|uniref:type 4a pilus biogenesis protein PilO n=1 Tax=uncultured Clostridium sp. TaxID=59620 RepID=UPI0026380546|nr:type 4a pilus biogenesis protein PilO [uncultured Clostridium sp.]